jgi:hypothetical protein
MTLVDPEGLDIINPTNCLSLKGQAADSCLKVLQDSSDNACASPFTVFICQGDEYGSPFANYDEFDIMQIPVSYSDEFYVFGYNVVASVSVGVGGQGLSSGTAYISPTWGTAPTDFTIGDTVFFPSLAPNNGHQLQAPLTPEQLHKQQQTQLNTRCAAASASSATLATNAGLNEVGATLSGEVTPFAAIFHGIALVEGIGAGGVGVYAAFACYNAAQF